MLHVFFFTSLLTVDFVCFVQRNFEILHVTVENTVIDSGMYKEYKETSHAVTVVNIVAAIHSWTYYLQTVIQIGKQLQLQYAAELLQNKTSNP